jgi:hypothetical protein
MRRPKVKGKILFAVIILLTISNLACANFAPSTGEGQNTVSKESYLYLEGNSVYRVNLITDISWEGSKTTTLKYSAGRSPWVLNAHFTTISSISSSFNIQVTKHTQFEGLDLVISSYRVGQDIIAVVNETGVFEIEVLASGVEWYIGIGVE